MGVEDVERFGGRQLFEIHMYIGRTSIALLI